MDNEKQEIIESRLKQLLSANKELEQRLNNDSQKNLVVCLLDGTVYSIVDSLKDLQYIRENDLFRERQTKLTELQKDPNIVEKLIEFDRSIVDQLDEITREQQSTLAVAGIPLFGVTNEPDEIRLQMAIIEFIRSLSDLFPNTS